MAILTKQLLMQIEGKQAIVHYLEEGGLLMSELEGRQCLK